MEEWVAGGERKTRRCHGGRIVTIETRTGYDVRESLAEENRFELEA